MSKELIKLAVIGLMLGSCVASCSNQPEKSADMESDESSCAGKNGCKGDKDSNSSGTGQKGSTGSYGS